jgi:hypothetical protein
MSNKDWPTVHKRDDGIRPAGSPTKCFYCDQRVGKLHATDCVIVTKLVELRVRVSIPQQRFLSGRWQDRVPHFWTANDIEFHKNESSWCADNLLRPQHRAQVFWEAGSEDGWSVLEAFKAANPDGCLCNILRFEFVRVLDQTPTRKIVPDPVLTIGQAVRSHR